MSGIGLNALLFFISTFFDLYLFVLIIRFFLALAGADYTHPMTQSVVKITNFVVRPLRKIIPDFNQIEFATLVLILVLEIIKFLIIITLTYGLPNLLGLIILAVGDTIKLTAQVLSFVFLLQLIMYFVQPSSPINQTLSQFTSPFMRPLEQALAPRGISYMWIAWAFAFVILQLVTAILVNPLLTQGLLTAIA
jgi:YggT family protein